MAHQLPPLSKHIRVLTAEESGILPDPPKTCITCGGEKTFRWWADYGNTDEVADYDCPCSEQFVLHRYLLNAGVQLALQRYAWGDLTHVDPAAKESMEIYLQDWEYYLSQGYGYVFRGDRGTGKTILAVLMLKDLLNKGVDGFYVTFPSLLDMYTDGWTDKPAKVRFDKKVRSSQLLVVDDIGKEHEHSNRVAATAIDNIFRDRVQAARTTIITTNLNADALRTNYSSALETIAGNAVSFVFKGQSFRDSLAHERRDKEMNLRLKRPVTIR